MSYELQKPYTDKQRADFIVEYNHNKGLCIQEGENGELFALEPFEKLVNGKVIDNTEDYENEQAQKERERINMLSLTAADVERAIYKAKGMDFEDVILSLSTGEGLREGADIDLKALKIELKANNFYRGNPYIEQVGALLGFTTQMLDEFFETNDYTKLIIPAEEQDSNAVDEGVNEVISPDQPTTPPIVKGVEDTPSNINTPEEEVNNPETASTGEETPEQVQDNAVEEVQNET